MRIIRSEGLDVLYVGDPLLLQYTGNQTWKEKYYWWIQLKYFFQCIILFHMGGVDYFSGPAPIRGRADWVVFLQWAT